MKHLHTNPKNKSSGFTLLEVLIAVAVLGLVASASLYALNHARQRSRDGKRIADLNTINKALELYQSENGHYPPSSCGYDCGGWLLSNNPEDWEMLEAELRPYTDILPVDPINTPNCNPWEEHCHAYAYGNVGRVTYEHTYDLTAQLETKNHPESCGQKNHVWYFDDRDWCGPGSEQIYEASPQ